VTVLVVGDVIDDVLVRPRGPVTPDSDTPAEIRSEPGGSGANTAAWLGSLGVPTRFAGRVGARDVARHTDALRGCGVEPQLAPDPLAATGALVALVQPDGTRTMFVDRGANARLGLADLPDELLDGVDLLHVSGYALFDLPARDAVLDLVDRARRRAVPTSVDPGSVAFLREASPAAFHAWTRGVTVLLPNRDEAAVLTGATDPAAMARALGAHHDVAVVTLGAQGAVACGRDGAVVRAPAVGTDVVDTTGAGDAFNAGFLAHWLTRAPLVDCLAAGNALAADAVRRLGARPVPHPVEEPAP
jgi:sugar/nucleoside kinase (ribokinase family)